MRLAESGEKTTLYILCGALLLMNAVSLLQSFLHGWTGACFTLAGEIVCLLPTLWLTYLGKTVWSTVIICLSELICGLLLTSVFGPGFRDEATLLFPLTLVTAAILLEWKPYIAFSVLVLAAVICSGLFLAETRVNPLHRIFNTVNILLTTVIAVGLLARTLKRNALQSRQAEQEIQALSARLIVAQEEERGRISRELHDDFGQQIAALSIGMSNLKRQIPADQSAALGHSDLIQKRLIELSESIRRLSHELHPAVLEYSGLPAALRGYCAEFGSLTSIRVTCTAHGSFEGVPDAVSLAVFRIAQEALQNVAKHAKINEAEVELSRDHGMLQLTVSDRGAGMVLKRKTAPRGLGFVSIRERTRLVNGSFDLSSQPNQGTTLRVTVPL